MRDNAGHHGAIVLPLFCIEEGAAWRTAEPLVGVANIVISIDCMQIKRDGAQAVCAIDEDRHSSAVTDLDQLVDRHQQS